MPSLHTIVYVDPTRRRVTAYLRTERGWEEVVQVAGTITLRDLALTLDVDAPYDEPVDDGGP